jgi:hypothetical protein
LKARTNSQQELASAPSAVSRGVGSFLPWARQSPDAPPLTAERDSWT